jgi:nitrogenase molybdenum-iron protein NifN
MNTVKKPLQVNPIKHSQPMGAALAFMGVKNCLPLMHGSKGCASFTKVFLTSHYNEPIPMYNTSVTDITAVLEGGYETILKAVENIINKYKFKPDLIGLHTTGLTETKGDDVKSVKNFIDIPYCYVNTPDFEGGMESGWALATKSLIEQFTEVKEEINYKKMLLLPNVSLQPVEIEKIKSFCESFGFETYALPDISTSLDGCLREGQGKLGNGDITLDDIKNLADSAYVVTIGESMKIAADALLEKNPKIKHKHFNSLTGLNATDNFVAFLMNISQKEPSEHIKKWRGRLLDAMLDTHFVISDNKFVITGEPDMCHGISELLYSVGAKIKAVIATTPSNVLKEIKAENVLVGDLEDTESFLNECDMLISNFHGERILHSLGSNAKLIVRGFPNYEEFGNQLKNDQLYEGGAYFLFEVANILNKELSHG